MKLRFLLLTPFILLNTGLYAQEAVVPAEPISLLKDPSFADFTFFLNPERSLTQKREEIWSVAENGLMHITGKGWGYLRSNTKYRDYHLVLEYKWGEHTVGYRADRARENGLFVHAFGKDGLLDNSWICSVEAQIMEGGTGDLLVLAATDDQGVKAQNRVTAKVRLDRDGETVWSPEGNSQTFPPPGKPTSRINWRGRDPDWTDVKGFRGQNDIENPVGEWNRMELVCQGDTLRFILNGQLVNEATEVFPAEGFICLQSEGAEMWVRRFELFPLDSFAESWQPKAVSTDTGMSETGENLLPRRFPWSPGQSLAAWHVDGDYDIELVAAEPLVCDPVDVVWDEQGRMYVAEMGDYPVPTEAGPLLSRIRLLSDVDGDGRMDRAITWADNLDHVQGLLPMKGGLLVTTRTAILFLTDSDNDGQADEPKQLYVSNHPRHSQLQVSSPRWGLDNAVYLNNGLDGAEIYPANQPALIIPFRGWDLRFDPRNGQLGKSTGKGQYGAAMDDFGRRFFSSNRNPIMFAVLSAEAMERNPFASTTVGFEDILPPAGPVWPLKLSRTTAAAHLGTYTAASGLGVYRGDRMPELAGDVFVCEPTAQLVTRNRVSPDGASFKAERIGDRRDFLASADEWCRPVQIRNGPDGALYICDMYRRFIDHAIFFPDAFVETNYMRAGLDQGRIWRLVPKGSQPRKIQPLPESGAALVGLLENENAWQRIHAQRLLVERQSTEVIAALLTLFRKSGSAKGRLHAMWTLQGLGALTTGLIGEALADTEPRVVESAITLADPVIHRSALLKLAEGEPSRLSFLAIQTLGASPVNDSATVDVLRANLLAGGIEDPWIRRAILSGKNPSSAKLLTTILEALNTTASNVGNRSADVSAFAREFTTEAVARGDPVGLQLILSQIIPGRSKATDGPIVEGLSAGLKRGALSTRSVAALISNPPAPLSRNDLAGVSAVLESAPQIALDRTQAVSLRLGVLPLVEEQGGDELFAIVQRLLDQREPPEIQSAACRLLSKLDRRKVAPFLFDHWDSLGTGPRAEALELLAGKEDTALLLMRRMKTGEINPSLMPAFRRWWLVRRPNVEVAALAHELFGKLDEDRAAVIADYAAALKEHPGDPGRGRQVFEKAACITCHRIAGTGMAVGPDLTDVRAKLPQALLSDILDPNRAVEERWALTNIETANGNTFAGLISGETATALEITLPGGHQETIARDQIVRMESNGASLMPVGFEATISKSEMADLLAFLTRP